MNWKDFQEKWELWTSEQQWNWVATQNEYPRNQCLIYLDNDSNSIMFTDADGKWVSDPDDKEEDLYFHFEDYIGNSAGAEHLLAALGYKTQPV